MSIGLRSVVPVVAGGGHGECVGVLSSIILHQAPPFELPSGLEIARPCIGSSSDSRPMFLAFLVQLQQAQVLRPRIANLCELPVLTPNYP